MFEYKFERVAITNGIRESQNNNMDEVENIIKEYANKGWKLVQVLVAPKEKSTVFAVNFYEIIFERELDQ